MPVGVIGRVSAGDRFGAARALKAQARELGAGRIWNVFGWTPVDSDPVKGWPPLNLYALVEPQDEGSNP